MARHTWTPEQDSKLRELHAQEHSLRDIADHLREHLGAADITHQHVGHRCKILGLLPQRVQTPANEERRQRIALLRDELAETLLADVVNMRQRIWDEYEVHISTPLGIEKLTLDLPDAKAAAEFAGATEKLLAALTRLEGLGGTRTVDTAKSMLTKLRKGIEAMDLDE